MSDEYGKLNKDEEFGDIIPTTGGVAGDDAATNIVSNIDDALRVVDNSNLPPAPVSARPVDKYGLPITKQLESIDKHGLLPKEKTHQPRKSAAPIRAITPGSSMVPANSKVPAKTVPSAITPAVVKRTPPAKIDEPEVTMPDFNEPQPERHSDDFKVKFDFDSAYRDPPENRPLRWRRERRTGLVGGILFALFILSIGLVLASVMWMATMDVLGFGDSDEEVQIQVPADFTMEGITDMLYDTGLIRYKGLFDMFAEYSGAEEKIAPGSYVLYKNYDYRALVQGMTARSGVRVETSVTIPEGYTLAQIFALLENEEVCSAEELWDTATNHDFNFYFLDRDTLGNRLRLEGFLFPDTYNFYKNSTPVQAINRMLRQFDSVFSETFVERAGVMGYTVHEIITVASMIEREAGSDEERPRIAAVIYNRLNNPANYPMLEIDATFFYAVAGTNIPPSPSVESEYNTYLYPGLPPGPIANPGLASITAALYPMSTNEYFYALNKEGTHNFFRNATDHRNFVNSDEFGG